MRIVSLVICVWILVEFEPGSTVPVVSEEDYQSGDGGGHVDEGDGDTAVGSAAKKSLHHYCLFHVDLRCRDTCTELGFANGKCYKGICVCKGAERIAVRKLRLSGQMIVPYLEDDTTASAATPRRSEGPVWFGGRSSSSGGGRDRDVVYNRKMLDDLVEASHRKHESTSSSSSTTHRPHREASTSVSERHEVRDYTTATSVSSGGGGASESSTGNRSAHHMPRRQRLHHHHHYREHRHRHVINDDDDNIIFELGHPQNLKGTIVGVAKEYDPQRLFSDEEEDEEEDTVTTSVLPPVIIRVSDADGTVVTGDVANLVVKLID